MFLSRCIHVDLSSTKLGLNSADFSSSRVKIVEQSCRKFDTKYMKYDDKVSKLFYLKKLDKKPRE